MHLSMRHIAKALFIVLILTVFYDIPGSAIAQEGFDRGTFSPLRAFGATQLVSGTVEVEASVSNTILQVLENASSIMVIQKYYAITDVRKEPDWLFISMAGFDAYESTKGWSLDKASWIGLVILRQDVNGSWTGAIEGTPDFRTLLFHVPDNIFSVRAKQDIAGYPVSGPTNVDAPTSSNYFFPWPFGTWMQYGNDGGGVFDAGFIKFPGYKAVNFFSDGNTGSGHAPNSLRAPSSSTVSYVCREATGTGAAFAFDGLLFSHLVNNGNIQVGTSFNQRDEITQMRVGTYTGGCGSSTQAANQFNMMLGFPNTGSFVASGWTLNIAAMTWSRAGNTLGPLSWFVEDSGDITPPEETYIDTPSDGAIIQGTLSISGWANDHGTGIKRLEVYIDGAYQGNAHYGNWRADLGSYVGYDWSTNSALFSDLGHTLTVRFIDNVGNYRDLSRSLTFHNTHNVSWISDNTLANIVTPAPYQVTVVVRNTGIDTWPAGGSTPVHLSYHWLDSNGNTVVPEGVRTNLPYDVPPNNTVTLNATINGPASAGNYILKWDMVHEGVTWFSGRGAPTRNVAVHVDLNIKPNPPIFNSPADETTSTSRTVSFSWQDGGDPDNKPQINHDYTIQIATDSGFTSLKTGIGYQWDSSPYYSLSWSTTLPGDGTYYWRLYEFDGGLGSGWSNSRRFVVYTAPPSPPATVSATDGTFTDRIQIIWSSVLIASSYEVWRNTTNSSGSAVQLTASASGTSYDDTSTTPGQTNYYWIKAKNANGTGAFSVSDFGFRALSAPGSVSATDGAYTDRISVSWPAVPNATNYEVWRNTSNSTSTATQLTVTVAATSFNDLNTAAGLVYYYWVKAKNSYITGDFSISDSGYSLMPSPAGVSASDGGFSDRVRITWNSVSSATSYEVWRNSTNNSGTAMQLTAAATGTSYDDTSVTPGQTYYYWVKAKNAYITSGFSAADSGYCVLAPPGSVSASDGNYGDRVQVAWAAVAGASSYEVWRGATNDSATASQVASSVTALSYDDVSVAPGQAYYYWVKAKNAYITSGFGGSNSGYVALATPGGVSASDGAYTDRVLVSWNTVVGATAYEVWRNSSSDSGTATQLASSVTGTSYEDTSIIPGQTYFYWVKAKSVTTSTSFSLSDSGYSSMASPAGIAASDGVYTDRVQITWSGVAGATGYEVWRNTANASSTATQISSTVSGISYNDMGTVPGQTYYYWIKARNAYIASAFSSADAGYRTLDTPKGVGASDGTYGDQVRVTWSALAEATGYEVWRNTVNITSGATILATVNGMSYDDTYLVYGQTYFYWVKAKNVFTTSGFGSVDAGYTPADTTPPEQTTVEAPQDNQIIQGQLSVDGWACDLGSGMDRVEVWLDGGYKGNAVYGLSRPDQVGNVGYHWETDSTVFVDGAHRLILWFYDRAGNSVDQTRIVKFNNRPVTVLKAVNNSPTMLGRATYFTATAAGDILVFFWTFGDGAGAIGSTASHQYAQAGIYTAMVTATNGVTGVVASTLVTVINMAPVAEAGLNQVVTVGLKTTLDGSASYDPDGQLPLSYRWLQTGGAPVTLSGASTAQPTFIAPMAPAIITFSLVVGDAYGLASSPDQVMVTVNDSAVSSLTAHSSSPTTLGQMTSFAATAVGSNLNFQWAFGDGTYASGSVVNHTYTGAGFFTAIVTASNNIGGLSTTVPVTVTSHPPVADAGPDQSVLVGAFVILDGSRSSDPDGHWPLAYDWKQVGGIPVTLSTHSTAQTTFTALSVPSVLTFTLTVTDSFGLVSTPDQAVITVTDKPLSGLRIYADGPTVLGLPTQFTAKLDTGTNAVYTWDFGEGAPIIQTSGNMSHIYSVAGIYHTVVTAVNAAGALTASITTTVYGLPLTSFNADTFLWVGKAGVFTNTSTPPAGSPPPTYLWDFGDGTAVDPTPAKLVTHTYAASGVYTVTLTAANPAGSSEVSHGMIIFGLPQVSFATDPISGTAPLVERLTNSTVPVDDPTMAYQWFFGDGETSTQRSPLHVYSQPGVYTVTLSASNGAGAGAIAASAYVTVLQGITGSVTTQPDRDVTLTFNAGVTVVVLFPAGLSSVPLTATYRILSGDIISGQLRPVGTSFNLQMVAGDGSDVTYFGCAYTVTIQYDHTMILGLNEYSLGLYYWDDSGGNWRPVPGNLDMDDNILTDTLDHMTRFAVLGQQWQTYLPVVAR